MNIKQIEEICFETRDFGNFARDQLKRVFGDKIDWSSSVKPFFQKLKECGHISEEPHDKFENIIRNPTGFREENSYLIVYYLYVVSSIGIDGEIFGHACDKFGISTDRPSSVEEVFAWVWKGRTQREKLKHHARCSKAIIALSSEFWNELSPELQYVGRSAPGASESELLSPYSKPESRLSQPILHFPEELLYEAAANGEGSSVSWLDPLATNALIFHGRQDELDLLNKFVDDERLFLCWAITGPSGAGKTRLVIEWMRQLRKRDEIKVREGGAWNIGFLGSQTRRAWDQKTEGSWDNWSPDRPTVIVIDNFDLFADDIKALFLRALDSARLDRQFIQKVRVLLVDRILSDQLDDMLRNKRLLGHPFGNITGSRTSQLFFSLQPLHLRPSEQSENVLFRIICDAGRIQGAELTPDVAQNALEELKKIEGAWCPLFAALRGWTLVLDPKVKLTQRRQLIRSYFERQNGLPWQRDDPDSISNGMWASAMVVAATLVGALPIEQLVSFLPMTLSDSQKKQIVMTGRFVTSSGDRFQIPAFKPDILGETFLFYFWEEVAQFDEDVRNALISMVSSAYTDQERLHRAEEFIRFIAQTYQNLENDELAWSIDYWRLLTSVLSPHRFLQGSPMRAAVSISLVWMREHLHSEVDNGKVTGTQVISLLLEQGNKIEFDELRTASCGALADISMVSFMRHFDRSSEQGRATPEMERSLLSAFKDSAVSYQQIHPSYWPLHIACEQGDLFVVKLLLKQNKNLIGSAAKRGVFALHTACAAGNEVAVEFLINETDVNINGRRSDGTTPLMIASDAGYLEIVKLLLSFPDLQVNDADDDGITALHRAAFRGFADIVALLIDRPNILVNALSTNDATPLFLASQEGHSPVVALLTGHDRVKVNLATKDESKTALIIAIARRHFDVVKFLLDHREIDVNSKTKDGLTAIFAACLIDDKQIVARLLKKHGIDISVVAYDHGTALDVAESLGSREVVKLLRKHSRSRIKNS